MLEKLMRKNFGEEVIDRLNESPTCWEHDDEESKNAVEKQLRNMFIMLGINKHWEGLVINTEIRKDGTKWDYFTIVKDEYYCKYH